MWSPSAAKASSVSRVRRSMARHWVETVQEMLHPGVKYRHLILTVPEGLRTLIYQHAAPLLEGLMQAARTAMDARGERRRSGRRSRWATSWCCKQPGGQRRTTRICTCCMTDGGLRADGTWQPLGYVPYDLLHRAWQEQVLALIDRPDCRETRRRHGWWRRCGGAIRAGLWPTCKGMCCPG